MVNSQKGSSTLQKSVFYVSKKNWKLLITHTLKNC